MDQFGVLVFLLCVASEILAFNSALVHSEFGLTRVELEFFRGQFNLWRQTRGERTQ